MVLLILFYRKNDKMFVFLTFYCIFGRSLCSFLCNWVWLLFALTVFFYTNGSELRNEKHGVFLDKPSDFVDKLLVDFRKTSFPQATATSYLCNYKRKKWYDVWCASYWSPCLCMVCRCLRTSSCTTTPHKDTTIVAIHTSYKKYANA